MYKNPNDSHLCVRQREDHDQLADKFNMKSKELLIQEKEVILKLRSKKHSIRDIAEKLSFPKTTVWNVLKQNKCNGSLHNRPRSGRPRITSATTDRKIARAVKINPKTTVSEICNGLKSAGTNVSKSTVRRRLREQGYRGYTARCKPLISAKNRKARVEFAKTYRNHTKEFWEKVLWTDETKINFYQSDGKAKIWRREGTAHNPKNTTSSVKHGGGSIMAWACMAASGTGSLVFIDDVTRDRSSIMNSEVYRDILSRHVRPNATRLVGRQFILQQDNDPKHTANATKQFIKTKKWKLLEWPSQSPDLNPIEHAFYLLKKRMASEFPRNRQELKQTALKAWESISLDYTARLVHSMPRRLEAVIANKGYSTKY